MNFNFIRFSTVWSHGARKISLRTGYAGTACVRAPCLRMFIFSEPRCGQEEAVSKLSASSKKTLKKWNKVRDAKAQIIV